MGTEQVNPDISIHYDDTLWAVRPSTPAGAQRRGPGLGGRPIPSALNPQAQASQGDVDWLIQTLSGGDTSCVALPELLRRPGAEVRSMDVAQSASVSVDLADGESAALLVECEGVVGWQLPDGVIDVSPGASPSRARPGAPVVRRQARFAVRAPGAATAVTQAQRGALIDWTLGRLKTVVIRFAAEHAAGAVVRHLESSKRTGPVVLNADSDASTWEKPETFAGVHLPERPARLLLFVHGTFSSTVGAFGDLTATPWGLAFMNEAADHYDALIGYDHLTLSVDPAVNARGLHEALKTLPANAGLTVDIVCHSRGALVVRSWIEQVLPHRDWKPTLGKVIFAGGTNAGTLLARPENWHGLLDMLTNLALASRKALSVMGFPQAGLAAGEVIGGISDFVRYLVDAAVEDKRAPGLAAMDPDGDYVRRLNVLEPGAPRPEDAQYYAVVSSFRPRLVDAERHEPKELPRRLALMLANGFMGALMQRAPNDLVVNVSSMAAIDLEAGTYVKDTQDFGTNPVVYHTNYFVQPETIDALASWLGLARLNAVAAVNAQVMDRRLVVAEATTPVRDALARARRDDAAFVVFSRPDPFGPGMLHYAASLGELLGLHPDTALGDALHVRESRRSRVLDNAPLLRSLAASAPAVEDEMPAYSLRTVVMEAGQPIAVMPPLASALEGLTRAAQVVQERLHRGGPAAAGAKARSTRGGDSAPPAPTELEQEASVSGAEQATLEPTALPAEPAVCQVQAEMPPTVERGRRTRVTVTLSVEQITAAAGALSQHTTVKLARRPVTVEVVPRVGFSLASENLEDGRIELPGPPEPGAPYVMDVDLLATHAGAGEVWALVRQGAMRMAMLVLRPTIVSEAVQSGAVPLVQTGTVTGATDDLPPVATLEISQQRNGDEMRFRFSVNVPGVAFNRFESPPIVGDLAAWVKTLYADIEQAWLGSKGSAEIFHDALQARGGTLARELVPPPLLALLWRLRSDKHLDSVLVLSDEPFVPWEIAWLDDPQKPGHADACFFGDLGLCRWLYGAVPPARIRMRPQRLRYVLPHYPEPSFRLGAAEDVEEPMLQAMGAEPVVPHYREVTAALQSGAFDLLHFAGHGEAQGDSISGAALLLQGTHQTVDGVLSYITEPLKADVVAQKVRLPGPDGNRPLVVVNACQIGRLGFNLTSLGGFAPAFLGARIGDTAASGQAGAFIGPLWAVGDAPASTFAKAFYDAVRTEGGCTVAAAVVAARQEARASGDATWLAYAIYAHPQCHLEFTP